MSKICTIMTPTYNRGYIIKSLYNSLKNQTDKTFEWLIVDDGSTDNTESIIKKLILNNDSFKIYYYKKENEGKHVAINYALDIVDAIISLLLIPMIVYLTMQLRL